MPPRSPLTGLAATLASVGEYCRSIQESLAKVRLPTLNVRAWAENRLDQAMRCPECEHGGELTAELAAENAAGCDCTDLLCACNPENMLDGSPVMSTSSELEQQARRLAESLTEALRPVTEGIRAAVAPLAADPRLRAGAIQRELIRDQLREVVGFADEEDFSPAAAAQNELAQERVETILAFIDLAKGHSLPRKLLPRGDRRGDWFEPGEAVSVLGDCGVVAQQLDMVRVKMQGMPVPIEVPRIAVKREDSR